MPPIPSRIAQPDPIHFRRPTPNLSDRIFYERHDTRGPRDYALPAIGTAHPNAELTAFKFSTAQPADDDPLIDLWFYVNERANQETYNGEDDFPFGSKDYPRRTRTTIVLRSAYSPIADLADDPVTSTLKLTSQGKTNLPDPVLNALFVQHVRVYEILPGPWIPFTRWSEELGPIQGRRRIVQNANTAPTLTATAKTTYEARDGSSIVAWQIEETNSDGTGGAGNPAFPVLVGGQRSSEVRGRAVVITEQAVAAGTAPDAGSLIISSLIEPGQFLSKRRNNTVSALPPDETWAFWDFVSIPLLLFSINNLVYCNYSQFFTVVSNPVTTGGSSVLRKHRTTVSYSATAPSPNHSSSTFTTRDIRYQGKLIQFSFNNVLNNALAYSEVASLTSGGGACSWLETYSFAASSPSASTFASGRWYTRDFKVEPWGTTGFRSVHTEFFSAAGNPDIAVTPSSAYASGTLTGTATNVANNDTVTIGSTVYTFKTTLTATTTAFEVLIGIDTDASLTYLIHAINRTGSPGVYYGSLTTIHPDVNASPIITAHAVTVTANATGAGGNSIATTEASTQLSWGAATLLGGA